MYQVTNRYEDDPTIFYSFKHREAYPSNHIDASKVASIGGERRIIAGSFITTTNRILPRSKLIGGYTSGATSLIVQNPWAFQVGDVIHAIGNLTESSAAADLASFTTPVPIGTVTALEQRVAKSVKRLTIASPAVGNIYSLRFDKGGKEARFTATNTNILDILNGLWESVRKLYSDFSILDYLDISLGSNFLEFAHKENNCPYLMEISQTGTGTSTLVEQNAVGVVYITPVGSNPSLGIGQKVGTLSDRPVGVTAREYLVSDIRDNPIVADVPIYNAGTLVKSALPYIDGQILSVLPKLAVYPAFNP
ncbi:MAG: hypothetical protein ACRDBG_08405 [Waterburya sp.]